MLRSCVCYRAPVAQSIRRLRTASRGRPSKLPPMALLASQHTFHAALAGSGSSAAASARSACQWKDGCCTCSGGCRPRSYWLFHELRNLGDVWRVGGSGSGSETVDTAWFGYQVVGDDSVAAHRVVGTVQVDGGSS
jgi:hypothetical protein